MNRIKLLPEQVANQIAAGEVVERPASVVKELVENSLDAGATRVDVEIRAGGRSLIRVTDDGTGMSRDDALLCLERHATSKIKRAEDLAAVATMGFRGEALPSIASVSRFTLTTHERDGGSPEGTQIIISGGKIMEVKSAGSPPGTSIEVRQLFFNLPARRKFLRSEETEQVHIQHYLTLAALSFPEVAFNYIKDGRTIWQLPPAISANAAETDRLTALRQRLRALYGDEQKLLPVEFAAEIITYQVSTNTHASDEPSSLEPVKAAFRVWGFIGAPGVSRATREDQHVFVNRRPIENRGLNYALLEGYHTSLMKGRYPLCCLFVEIPPGEVDVNIHPAKREVKFHREMDVRRLVAQAVRQALLEVASKPASATEALPGTTGSSSPASAKVAALPNFPEPLRPADPAPQGTKQIPFAMGFAGQPSSALSRSVLPAAPEPGARTEPISRSANAPPVQPVAREEELRSPSSQMPQAHGALPLLKVPLRLVGVIGRLYVVLESDRGLVLLDQHAAHERILFEQMMSRLEQNQQASSQRLLLPETVELSPRDAGFLREQLSILTRLGVGLSEFGDRTFLLDALPPFVKMTEPRKFVLQLVDELKAAGQNVNSLRLGEHTVAKTVCRHAVKANDPLAGPELESLVNDLRRCAMPYTCPHGRPTLIEMNYRELEKKFGRSA
jgi:DNA mismatch repair protein MutL